mmetsp:Transcript_168650/g.541908  ORF Transcript_168650/g.541908 Transcript_168650/m.541908 type:complete len:1026 (-) Transcript_168650:57-3134(-)
MAAAEPHPAAAKSAEMPAEVLGVEAEMDDAELEEAAQVALAWGLAAVEVAEADGRGRGGELVAGASAEPTCEAESAASSEALALEAQEAKWLSQRAGELRHKLALHGERCIQECRLAARHEAEAAQARFAGEVADAGGEVELREREAAEQEQALRGAERRLAEAERAARAAEQRLLRLQPPSDKSQRRRRGGGSGGSAGGGGCGEVAEVDATEVEEAHQAAMRRLEEAHQTEVSAIEEELVQAHNEEALSTERAQAHLDEAKVEAERLSMRAAEVAAECGSAGALKRQLQQCGERSSDLESSVARLSTSLKKSDTLIEQLAKQNADLSYAAEHGEAGLRKALDGSRTRERQLEEELEGFLKSEAAGDALQEQLETSAEMVAGFEAAVAQLAGKLQELRQRDASCAESKQKVPWREERDGLRMELVSLHAAEESSHVDVACMQAEVDELRAHATGASGAAAAEASEEGPGDEPEGSSCDAWRAEEEEMREALLEAQARLDARERRIRLLAWRIGSGDAGDGRTVAATAAPSRASASRLRAGERRVADLEALAAEQGARLEASEQRHQELLSRHRGPTPGADRATPLDRPRSRRGGGGGVGATVDGIPKAWAWPAPTPASSSTAVAGGAVGAPRLRGGSGCAAEADVHFASVSDAGSWSDGTWSDVARCSDLTAGSGRCWHPGRGSRHRTSAATAAAAVVAAAAVEGRSGGLGRWEFGGGGSAPASSSTAPPPTASPAAAVARTPGTVEIMLRATAVPSSGRLWAPVPPPAVGKGEDEDGVRAQGGFGGYREETWPSWRHSSQRVAADAPDDDRERQRWPAWQRPTEGLRALLGDVGEERPSPDVGREQWSGWQRPAEANGGYTGWSSRQAGRESGNDRWSAWSAPTEGDDRGEHRSSDWRALAQADDAGERTSGWYRPAVADASQRGAWRRQDESESGAGRQPVHGDRGLLGERRHSWRGIAEHELEDTEDGDQPRHWQRLVQPLQNGGAEEVRWRVWRDGGGQDAAGSAFGGRQGYDRHVAVGGW